VSSLHVFIDMLPYLGFERSDYASGGLCCVRNVQYAGQQDIKNQIGV
jgi:hypothetical protein